MYVAVGAVGTASKSILKLFNAFCLGGFCVVNVWFKLVFVDFCNEANSDLKKEKKEEEEEEEIFYDDNLLVFKD